MLKNIAHIGFTVSDIEKSITFYQSILGLSYQGQMTMEGEATEKLFQLSDCIVKVAYLESSTEISVPPIELIQFVSNKLTTIPSRLNQISISEVCFYVDDIHEVYHTLLKKGVEFLSEPQYFDLRSQGFGESWAVYFKDPDGILLELMENVNKNN